MARYVRPLIPASRKAVYKGGGLYVLIRKAVLVGGYSRSLSLRHWGGTLSDETRPPAASELPASRSKWERIVRGQMILTQFARSSCRLAYSMCLLLGFPLIDLIRRRIGFLDGSGETIASRSSNLHRYTALSLTDAPTTPISLEHSLLSTWLSPHQFRLTPGTDTHAALLSPQI